jgi:hypothetical protein
MRVRLLVLAIAKGCSHLLLFARVATGSRWSVFFVFFLVFLHAFMHGLGRA